MELAMLRMSMCSVDPPAIKASNMQEVGHLWNVTSNTFYANSEVLLC